MTKKEVFQILQTIEEVYSAFEITQTKIDAWHSVLADYEKDSVMDNLKRYMSMNEFPPKIAHLTKGLTVQQSTTPTVEETQQYLIRLERHKQTAFAMSEEELKFHRNKARAALGMAAV